MIRPTCLLILLMSAGICRAADPLVESSVGMSARLDAVVLPGPELMTKPLEVRDAPLVVRIVNVYPHGTDFRYDLEYYGLAPGTYDLRDSLKRKDGQPLAANVKSLPVKVVPVLPPGQVMPNELVLEASPALGGYRTVKIVTITAWLAGLVLIVGWMLLSRSRAKATTVADAPKSLADRLRPLVEGAIQGRATPDELAALERSLLAYWRKKMGTERAEPAAAIAQLRSHPDAGPLLNSLEEWLHRPGPPAAVDVGELLRPYQNLPPDDLERGGEA